MMKILLVGVSVRSMVESAIRSNYPVIALDAFGDQDLKAMAEAYSLRRDFDARYSAKALYKASRQLAFDAVAYTSNLENHPEILSRFAASHRLIGNSPQAVSSVRCWPALFPRLGRAGFAVPETIFGSERTKIDANRRWLLKPVLSGGGQGVAFLRKGKLPGDRFMLQEFIPGKPCSASFVANGRESVLLGVSEQLVGMRQFGSQGFRYCGNILPLPEVLHPNTGKNILEQARRLAEFLAQEYGLTGVNGVDFILNGDQVWLTEVNPRYSASMELMEQAYGLSIFDLHAKALLNGELPEFKLESHLKGKRFFAKTILFAGRDAIAPETQTWHSGAIRDIPAYGERLRKGGPVCTILASCPTYDETFAELIRRAAMLRDEIYDQTYNDVDNGAFCPAGGKELKAC
jgi:predicted ATP-grasp superfamily ATP-dependent carboligase